MGTSKYSSEFRADAVALYHSSPGGTYASVAKDLGVNHETLRTWVRDAEQAARPGAVEATAMEKENRQLRARVKELDQRPAALLGQIVRRVSLRQHVAGRPVQRRPVQPPDDQRHSEHGCGQGAQRLLHLQPRPRRRLVPGMDQVDPRRTRPEDKTP